MRFRYALKFATISFCLVLTGCTWLTEQVVDHKAGFPASEIASDVKKTSDEYEEEKHRERVEELSRDYEEFLRSQETLGDSEDTAQQSVIIKRERKYDE